MFSLSKLLAGYLAIFGFIMCLDSSIAAIPEDVLATMQEQIATQLDTTCSELINKEKICSELYFGWPLNPPGKNEEELQKEVEQLVKQQSEAEFPSSLKDKYQQEGEAEFQSFEIGDLINIQLKSGRKVEGYFRKKSKKDVLIDNTTVSLFDLEDEELAHFNPMIKELKTKEYVRGKMAALKEARESYGSKIKDNIAIDLYKKYGYIRVNGEWIAKTEFNDGKLAERRMKLRKKLKPMVTTKVYYDSGYVFYNEDWMTVGEVRKIKALLEEQKKLLEAQQEEPQEDSEEGESDDDEGGLWD